MCIYVYKDNEIPDLENIYVSVSSSRCGTHPVPASVVNASAKYFQAQKIFPTSIA